VFGSATSARVSFGKNNQDPNNDGELFINVDTKKSAAQLIADQKLAEKNRAGNTIIKTSKVVIDGLPGTLLIATNDEIKNDIPTWEYNAVLVEKDAVTYVLSNGAIKSNNFEEFYKSFRFSTDWLPFSSSYFTLSFKFPSGFEVKEAQNHILIAKSPYYTVDIGGNNSFLYLNRYDERNTRESMIAYYKKSLKNWKESQIIVDGSSFLTIKGTDIGGFEGDSAGRIMAVFFDASWLRIMERPLNKDQDFDPIAIGNEILATFKFSK